MTHWVTHAARGVSAINPRVHSIPVHQGRLDLQLVEQSVEASPFAVVTPGRHANRARAHLLPGWLLWIAFMSLFLVPTSRYGGGYYGWGLPYPRDALRRGALLAPATSDSIVFNHAAWGWVGDLIWVVFIVRARWAAASLWWLR